MQRRFLILIVIFLVSGGAEALTLKEKIDLLPVFDELASTKTPFDWILTPEKSFAGVYRSSDGKSIILANGMVWRTFRVFPNLATTDYVNRMTGERMLRAVGTEGSVVIDGKNYEIGGLQGQEERGYLLEDWIEKMTSVDSCFRVADFDVQPIPQSIPWKRTRWALNTEDAKGKEIIFTLRGMGEVSDVIIRLHFGIFDNIPVIQKNF